MDGKHRVSALIRPGDARQSAGIDFWAPGFFMEYGGAEGRTRPLHWHNEIEMALLVRGRCTEVFGQERITWHRGQLVLLWGVTPHGIGEFSPQLLTHSLHIPLPWFLQWNLPESITAPVLAGTMLFDALRHSPCTDIALFGHWQELMDEGTVEAREIVALDAMRRLRLMAHTRPAAAVTANLPAAHPMGAFERMAVTMVTRHAEPIGVADVAAAAGLSESHAMRVFREASGMTINDYLMRTRLATAQRLLITTNLKIAAIAGQSGFHSACRLYAAFRDMVGATPRAFRTQARTE